MSLGRCASPLQKQLLELLEIRAHARESSVYRLATVANQATENVGAAFHRDIV